MVSDIFYFHPEPWGNDPNFDEHIFQLGWFNHQLAILLLVIFFLIFVSWFTRTPSTRCNGFLWSDGPRRGAHHFCFPVRGNRRFRWGGGLELVGFSPQKSGLKEKHNDLIKTYFNRKYIFPTMDLQGTLTLVFQWKKGFGRLLWFPA